MAAEITVELPSFASGLRAGSSAQQGSSATCRRLHVFSELLQECSTATPSVSENQASARALESACRPEVAIVRSCFSVKATRLAGIVASVQVLRSPSDSGANRALISPLLQCSKSRARARAETRSSRNPLLKLAEDMKTAPTGAPIILALPLVRNLARNCQNPYRQNTVDSPSMLSLLLYGTVDSPSIRRPPKSKSQTH